MTGVGKGVGRALTSLGDDDELETMLNGGAPKAQREAGSPAPQPRSAPGQLMQFSVEMQMYQRKIEELEAALADKARTKLAVAKISPNPWQPRKEFNAEQMTELAESIRELGLIQPIVVRVKPGTSGEDISYQLVAGERRWRAHKMLGLEFIEAVIVDRPDSEMFVLALAENIGRAGLSHYEVYVSITHGEKEFQSRKAMAEALGMSRRRLYDYLRFEKLPEYVIADLEEQPRLLGADAAREIVKVLEELGAPARDIFHGIWEEFKRNRFDQGKFEALIRHGIRAGGDGNRGPRDTRSISKFWNGSEHAATITKDGSKFSISIKAPLLKPEQEAQLRELISSFYQAKP